MIAERGMRNSLIIRCAAPVPPYFVARESSCRVSSQYSFVALDFVGDEVTASRVDGAAAGQPDIQWSFVERNGDSARSGLGHYS